jgi:hypothetical protein
MQIRLDNCGDMNISYSLLQYFPFFRCAVVEIRDVQHPQACRQAAPGFQPLVNSSCIALHTSVQPSGNIIQVQLLGMRPQPVGNIHLQALA